MSGRATRKAKTMTENIPAGQILTSEQADEQVRNSTLTGRDRYRVLPYNDTSWMVWDHEEAERVADRFGQTTFVSIEDAHDLAMEYAG